MFKRKLVALDYHNPNNFNINDEAEFRNLIVWLEDQKIRHYKIEDRGPLRSISAGDWQNALKQYLSDLGSPDYSDNRSAQLDWILGYAVRLEYGDNADKFRNAGGKTSTGDAAKGANPLDGMDFASADFKAGVTSLSQLLQLPPYHDHEVVLKAVCLLIKEKLSKDVVEKAQKMSAKTEENIPLDKVELGFETGDYISMEAAKILRLLHLRDLRNLQTQINEAIVRVQALTANPKTDARLGKVGRF